MATINYKEKYEKAVHAAMLAKQDTESAVTIGILETIFPELRESEDEKIRNQIIEHIKWSYDEYECAEEEMHRWISWLEKKGEKKVSEYDIVKTIKERIIEHFDNHLIIDKCFSIGGLKDDILKIINEVKFAKQGEQKPAWSEEDEEHVNSLLKRLEGLCRNEFATTRFAISEDEDWLKSLRPHNKWKPSDEQMEAMQKALVDLCGKDEHNIITGLYYDLKKLKE